MITTQLLRRVSKTEISGRLQLFAIPEQERANNQEVWALEKPQGVAVSNALNEKWWKAAQGS